MAVNPKQVTALNLALRVPNTAHPDVQQAFKDIQTQFNQLSISVASNTNSGNNIGSVTAQLATLQSQITELAAKVAVLGVSGSVPPIVETFILSGSIPYPGAAYEIAKQTAAAADGSALATVSPLLGIATGSAPGGKVKITTFGDVDSTAWSWDVTSDPVPIFVGTAGQLTQTPPTSGSLIIIGYAITATRIRVCISEAITFGSTSTQVIALNPGGGFGVTTISGGGGQPTSFAYVSNPGTVVNSTTANNVVDTRTVAAGKVTANQNVIGKFRAFLTGTNGTKSLSMALSTDSGASALTAVFSATQVGIVEFTVTLVIAASGTTQLLLSRCDSQSGYAFGGISRATLTLNPATTAFNLLTEAWVANSGDSIIIDSVEWRVEGNGL